jgi:hypothetical protein
MNHQRDAQHRKPCRVVRLIEYEGDAELRPTGTQRLRQGANPTMVDDRLGAREEATMWRVVDGEYARRQRGGQCGPVFLVASQQYCPAAQILQGLERGLQELPVPFGILLRAQGEDDRRGAGADEALELRHEGRHRPRVFDEQEAGLPGVGRPVGLWLSDQGREQPQFGSRTHRTPILIVICEWRPG